jgi:hypothetical protein
MFVCKWFLNVYVSCFVSFFVKTKCKCLFHVLFNIGASVLFIVFVYCLCENKVRSVCEDKVRSVCEDKVRSVCEDKVRSVCEDKVRSVCLLSLINVL